MKSRFENPWPHETHGIIDILRWKLRRGLMEQPEIPGASNEPAEWCQVDPREISEPPEAGWRATWLGHASFLLQGGGISLLIDPIFSKHCSPLPLRSMQRKVPPPCAIADLPAVDAVLLTHSHYDHLDLPTLRKLGMNTPIVTPEGHAGWLGKKGFSNVCEIAWHSSRELSARVKITATPAQHFTARTPFDRNSGHWCGWLIEGAGIKLWHAGDSGYCPGFAEIGERYGPIDFGMIPIGAYLPKQIMRAMHMEPADSVRAFQDTRCRRAMAMHWGTFQLTDEPMREPVELLASALKKQNLPADCFTAGRVGEIRYIIPDVTT
jgi:N-acyl-phosphatidylethanolamine-hydrolysing phospholipase D